MVVLSFRGLALPLLVPRILANHHHATVPANHLALVADLLDTRLDFHQLLSAEDVDGLRVVTCADRRCAHESSHTEKVRRLLGRPEGCGCSAVASCH